MNVEIVPLTYAHLASLPLPTGLDQRAYFTPGSIARCVLADGVPVLAGGIVNLFWGRGEAWILPTDYYRSHFKTCFRLLRDTIPHMAVRGRFARVQATCLCGVSGSFFRHLGFEYEGTMRHFGPQGEMCDMYARIFEVHP